jgi:hypothetical protein
MAKQMTVIPGGPDDLSAAWLTDALRSTGVLNKAAVTGIGVRRIGEGSGFIGQIAQVGLTYDEPEQGAPKTLIAKFPGASPAGREIGNLFDFYHRELRFYREVAPKVDLRTPKLLYSDMDRERQEYILLLEDLSPAEVGDQVAGLSVAHTELAIREIARFHAAWWERPELESFAEWMPVVDAPVHRSAEQSYAQAWEPFIANFGERLSPKTRETAERVGQNVVKLQSSIADRPHTIVHADFRADNMFFATPEGGPEFALADWQIACRGRGIFDVAYLLCGGMEPADRQAQEGRLVRLYHDTLLKHGVTGYGWEQCWREYRRMALYVLVYVVISLGTLDFANERGLALFDAWLRRATAAIEHLDAAEEMPS